MAVPHVSEEPFCYITTTGRRTGRPHTIEIWFTCVGDVLYVMGEGHGRSDWIRNLRADGRAIVQIGQERFDATARFLQRGTDEDARARRLLVRKYQRSAGELETWESTALAVALDLRRSAER